MNNLYALRSKIQEQIPKNKRTYSNSKYDSESYDLGRNGSLEWVDEQLRIFEKELESRLAQLKKDLEEFSVNRGPGYPGMNNPLRRKQLRAQQIREIKFGIAELELVLGKKEGEKK